jgi:beta-galactosidase
VHDLLSGAALDAGAELTLGSWDVRVLVERDTSPDQEVGQ